MSTENAVEYITRPYLYFVKHVVAGPLSISWLFPTFILPVALMIPPDKLSHAQLIYFFLVPIFASTVHAWMAMGGVDVVSVDMLCWSVYLLAVNDPRVKFRRVRYVPPIEIAHGHCTDSQKDNMTQNVNGKADDSLAPVGGDGQVPVHHINGIPTGNGRTAEPQPLPQPLMDDEPYPSEFVPRLRWVLNLISSDRLVRWKTGSSRHDSQQKKPVPTRLQYTLSLVPVILLALLTICVTSLLANHDPYFRNATTIHVASPYPINSPPKPMTVKFLQHVLPPFLLRPLTLGFYSWSILTFEFNLIPLLPIYVNYLTGSRFPPDNWSPHTLPAYFGSFSSVLDGGLRRAWGTWWHQHMRFMIIAPGLAVAKLFGLPEHSTTGRTLAQVSAFLFSGIAHMGLVPPEPVLAKGGTSPMTLRFRIAGFFWVQLIGCVFEAVVEKSVKQFVGSSEIFSRGLGKVVKRTVIIAWVILWLSVTLRLPTVPFSELGYWDLVALPFFPTPLRSFLAGNWLP